jgi:hypothetical protein
MAGDVRIALGGELFERGVKRVHDPSINQKGRRPKPTPQAFTSSCRYMLLFVQVFVAASQCIFAFSQAALVVGVAANAGVTKAAARPIATII